MGHPYVDGHHTVELSISAGSVKTYVIFADVHIYQVVRSIDYFNQSSQAPPITANYQWSARTPAMVKLVNHPVIPAGFTEVPVGDLAAGPARAHRPGCARATGAGVSASSFCRA